MRLSKINNIRGRHKDKVIAVLGGGPSLDVNIEADIYISANDHAAKLRKCDYVACVDHVHQRLKVPMREHLSALGIPIVSHRLWADYVTDMGAASNSGLYAIYAGYLMGGNPVLVSGVDCYRGKTYIDSDIEHPWKKFPDTFFLRQAAKLSDIIGTDRVRVIGDGLLSDVFPQYDPDESFDPVDHIEQGERRSFVVVHPCEVGGRLRTPGTMVASKRTDEIQRLIYESKLVEAR